MSVSTMYTNDNNQHKVVLAEPECDCQQKVYRAINDFISNNVPPYLGEGMCIDICKACFESGAEDLILRPEISANDQHSKVAFTITKDSLAQDYYGDYELRISFHSQEEDEE